MPSSQCPLDDRERAELLNFIGSEPLVADDKTLGAEQEANDEVHT
ncbi:hypothetical protein N9B17_03880 [Rhodopirellula sp.]|nr:hypothetical protein [Rhodopirellula sp.]